MIEQEDYITSQHLLGWGLGLDDYREMFDLKDEDLSAKILECFPGATSFNAQAKKLKADIISCDRIYKYKPDQLEKFIQQHMQQMKTLLEQQNLSLDKFDSLDALLEYRQQHIKEFLTDFKKPGAENRYIAKSLDDSFFDDMDFDLALCSHDLFAGHSDNIDFHLDVISRLSELADEIRIFPLLNQNSEISELVGPITLLLQQNNFGVEIREVKYHLQPKGNAMLRIWAQECVI